MYKNATFFKCRALINFSICKFDKVLYICVIHACDKFLAAELAEIKLQIEPSLCVAGTFLTPCQIQCEYSLIIFMYV